MKKSLLSIMVMVLAATMLNAQNVMVIDDFEGNTSAGIGTAEPGPAYGAGVSTITYEDNMLRSDYSWTNADWFPRAVFYRMDEYINCADYPVLIVKFMVTDNFNDSIPVRLDLYGEGTYNDTVRQEMETNVNPWEIMAANGEWYDVQDDFIANNRFACNYWNGGIPETRVDSTRINGFEAFAHYGDAAFNGQAGTLYIDYIKVADGKVGINEFVYGKETAFSLAVYPNPTVNSVNVNAENEIQSINVFDMTGKSVMVVEDVMSRARTLDVSNLNTGLYFVNVQDLDGNSVSKKLQIK